jgi:hypothetical protein
MADNAPLDPEAMWRELIGKWEKAANELANQTMGSDEFSRTMNRMMGAQVDFQKSFGDLISRYLVSLNLPSRSEMVEIGERLGAIETSIERIATTLDRIAGTPSGAATAARPPRTKQPPSKSAPAPETAT